MSSETRKPSKSFKRSTDLILQAKLKPKYPVYVPSKGRHDYCQTVVQFARYGTPYKLVVEDDEHDDYAARFGEKNILVLPWKDRGLMESRKWIMGHSIEHYGAARHWQFDDNIRVFMRVHKGKRVPIMPSVAMRAIEEFSDRYTNVGISGMNYKMFVTKRQIHPITVNCHVYSMTLINNEVEQRWRLKRNDDTDFCLQVLAAGWCTVLFHTFVGDKLRTMIVRGGNTDDLYQGDGRLKMSRDLERLWPKVVTTRRRFGRPQHHVADSWKRFKQPLIRRDDIDWDNIPPFDEFGMELSELGEVKNPRLRRFIEQERTDAIGGRGEQEATSSD